jgi:MoaA/NifB/PqqE/SkfB family radical SAM enzyme
MTTIPDIDPTPRLVELEITWACQLSCAHCLTSSHPGAGHGAMTLTDWMDAVRQAHTEGAETIQLIGGEPTASPIWMELIDFILGFEGLTVQVYSNLYSVTDWHWKIFKNERITLATSFYSDLPNEHDQVTGKPGSHARTLANIIKALERRVPLQVGIVKVLPEQRVEEAKALLLARGIPENLVKIDRARGVGRANPLPGTDAPASELCGRCGDGRLAILPDGTVAPCVLGRGLRGGNLLKGDTLADILAGPTWEEHMRAVPRQSASAGCTPGDSNDCDPANTTACAPAYNVSDPYPAVNLSRALTLTPTEG